MVRKILCLHCISELNKKEPLRVVSNVRMMNSLFWLYYNSPISYVL